MRTYLLASVIFLASCTGDTGLEINGKDVKHASIYSLKSSYHSQDPQKLVTDKVLHQIPEGYTVYPMSEPNFDPTEEKVLHTGDIKELREILNTTPQGQSPANKCIPVYRDVIEFTPDYKDKYLGHISICFECESVLFSPGFPEAYSKLNQHELVVKLKAFFKSKGLTTGLAGFRSMKDVYAAK